MSADTMGSNWAYCERQAAIEASNAKIMQRCYREILRNTQRARLLSVSVLPRTVDFELYYYGSVSDALAFRSYL
jgi:hypothetical protein